MTIAPLLSTRYILILILMIFNHILKFSSQLFLICLLHPKIEYTDL